MQISPELQYTDGYHAIARNLLEGNGYRLDATGPLTTERAPAYPFFLLAVFSIAGVDYTWVQVVQACVGGLSCWLLFLLGRWALSAEVGLASAALFAVYPNAIEYSARLYAENVYFPIFLSFAYFLCRASLQPSAKYSVMTGVSWGASLLTRGTLLPFPFILPFGILLSQAHRSYRTVAKWLLPAALAALVVITPWTVRNYSITGALVPVSTWGWAPLYHGTQVAKRMTEWVDLIDVDIAATLHVRRLFREQNNDDLQPRDHYAIRYDHFAKNLTLADWKNDKLGKAFRSIIGIGYAWFFTFGAKLRAVSLAVHLPLLVMFIAGAICMARRHKEAFIRTWPALGLILYINLFCAISYPHVRYMSPAIALSFIFSGYYIIELMRRFATPFLHRAKRKIEP